MHADSLTFVCLVAVPLVGLATAGVFARALRRGWVPEVDAVTAWVLACVLIVAALEAAIQVVAFSRLAGLSSGLPVMVISLLFLGLLGVSARVLSRRVAMDEGFGTPLSRRGGSRRADWWCLGVVGMAHALLLAEGLSRPPDGHDALKYHLPTVVTWMRADALVMRPENWMFSLPGNAELVLWWLLKAGFERIASVAYWPAGVLLAGAVWSIVRAQRGSRLAGVVAVATVLSTSVIVRQMYSSYIDLFGASFLAAAITAFLLAASKDRPRSVRRLLVVMAGLAIGIALGTKLVNLAYASAIAAVFFIVHLYRNRSDRDLVFIVPAFALACAVCSAFWYVRSTLGTGNPVFPIPVAIAGHEVFKGLDAGWWQDDEHLWYVLGSLERVIGLLGRFPDYAATLNAKVGGVGPLFSMFVPLGMAVAAAGILLRGRRAMRHDRLVVLLLTVVLFLVWVLAIRHYFRFGMIYLAIAVCLAAPVVGRVARFWPRPVYAAALVATCLACASVTITPVEKLIDRIASGDLSRAGYYGIPKLIDDLPPGARIANLTLPTSAGRALTYPLYGKGLKNDAIDYMTTEALFPDLKPTLEELQDLAVEYVFIRAPFPDDWRDENRLELIYDDEQDPSRPPSQPPSRVYRVPRRTGFATQGPVGARS